MTTLKDQRLVSRSIGRGLVALIDGRPYPLIDVSIAGVSFQDDTPRAGQALSLTLARTDAPEDRVDGRLRVVSATGGTTRGELAITVPMVLYVIRHLARVAEA